MSQSDDERISTRAELLDEETAAGSADPEQQARVILEESDARTEDPEGTREDSSQTLDAQDQPQEKPGS